MLSLASLATVRAPIKFRKSSRLGALSASDPDEFESLCATRYRDFAYETNARRVILLFDYVGIKRGKLARLQHIAERSERRSIVVQNREHRCLVFCHAGRKLLIVGIPSALARFHDYASHRAIYSRL